jgi:hypothetical protein
VDREARRRQLLLLVAGVGSFRCHDGWEERAAASRTASV